MTQRQSSFTDRIAVPSLLILRALRFYEAVGSQDLFDNMRVPTDAVGRNSWAQAMTRLQASGYVTSVPGFDSAWRKVNVYSITPTGRQILAERLLLEPNTAKDCPLTPHKKRRRPIKRSMRHSNPDQIKTIQIPYVSLKQTAKEWLAELATKRSK